MNVTTATPAQLDAELLRVSGIIARAEAILERKRTTGAAKAEATIQRNAAQIVVEQISAEWDRRGGWTRFFLVSGGHLHNDASGYRCSRQHTTQQFLIADLSGSTAEAAVEEAGERACTTCFPWAPVATLARPSRLHTADELEQELARAEKDRKRQAAAKAKADKSIAHPDGEPLLDIIDWKITTEAAAQATYRNLVAEQTNANDDDLHRLFRGKHQTEAEYLAIRDRRNAEIEPKIRRALEALAFKHDNTLDQERELHAKAIATKVRKERKESLAIRRANLDLYAIQDEA